MNKAFVKCDLRVADYHKKSFETITAHIHHRNQESPPIPILFRKDQVLIEGEQAYVPCLIQSEALSGGKVCLLVGSDRIPWEVHQNQVFREEN